MSQKTKQIYKNIAKKPAKKAKKAPFRFLKPSELVYGLDSEFEFFNELRDLILKSSPAEKDKIMQRVYKLGQIKLVVIAGIFAGKENNDPLATDLLLVGDDINRKKLHAFLRTLEANAGKEIKFAVMDKEEFLYRLSMFDRFVKALLEGPHEKLINKLGI